jgi:poly(3-hydroxybutyrate) depolymerase
MILLAPALLAFLAQTEGPTASQQKELVEAYFAADAKSAAGQKERRRILRELAPVELTPSGAPKELATVLKRWAKGREFEKKSGRRHWWEEEKRGLYIVGGETKKPKALAICMHGGGVGSGDAGSAHDSYEPSLSGLDWLAIYPEVLEKTECGWTDSGTEEWVLELIDCARRTWDIDPNRVYLCGHSMGGYGSWTLGAHHADQLAAVAPSAGGPTPFFDRDGKTIGIAEGVVPNLRNLAIRIYQSGDDPQVPPDANRFAVKLLEEAKKLYGGFDFEYWEVDGRGHGAPPGGFEAHLAKIAEIERVTHPDTVVWQPALAWKQQFYWLWWDEPVKNALVVARIGPEKNTVRLTTTGDSRGLAVLVDPKLLDPKKEIFVYKNEVLAWRGIPVPDLATTLATGARGDPELAYTTKITLP